MHRLASLVPTQRPSMMRTVSDHRELRAVLLLGAVSVLITLAFAAPVLQAPSERLIGREIAGRHHDAYHYISQFESPPRWHFFTQPITDWPGSLLGVRLGGTGAYNLLILLTFPLTTLTTYALARYLGSERPAAAFVALLFSFAPFHVAHSAYHPHIAQLQWLPLMLLAAFALLEHPSRKTVAAFTASVLVLVGASFYNALILIGVLPVTVLAFAASSPPQTRRAALRGSAAVLASLVGLASAGLLGLLLFAPGLLRSWNWPRFVATDLPLYSARFWSYLVPPVGHPLLGGAAERFWLDHPLRTGIVEHQLYVGVALLVLAVYAIARPATAEPHRMRQRRLTLVAVALSAFVVSLAPTLDIGHYRVLRPSAIFHVVAPMFRAYARVGAVATLAVALLAALGLGSLWRRLGRARWAGVALSCVAILELTPLPPWRWHDILPTQAHRWLAEQTGSLQILDCVQPTPGQQSITELMPHPTSVLGVFVHPPSNVLSHRFWFDDTLLDPVRPISDCAEPGLPGKLATMGYTHLLVRSEYRLRDLVPTDGVTLIKTFDDALVYRVDAAPAPFYTERIEGFSWRSAAATRSARWMGSQGRWTVVNPGPATLEARLELDAQAFYRPRMTRVLLDGELVAELEIRPQMARYELHSLSLDPGENVLSFEPLGEPTVPADVVDSRDQRPLTIAVGHWAWSLEEN